MQFIKKLRHMAKFATPLAAGGYWFWVYAAELARLLHHLL